MAAFLAGVCPCLYHRFFNILGLISDTFTPEKAELGEKISSFHHLITFRFPQEHEKLEAKLHTPESFRTCGVVIRPGPYDTLKFKMRLHELEVVRKATCPMCRLKISGSASNLTLR